MLAYTCARQNTLLYTACDSRGVDIETFLLVANGHQPFSATERCWNNSIRANRIVHPTFVDRGSFSS